MEPSEIGGDPSLTPRADQLDMLAVARQLEMSVRTVRRWATQGRIPSKVDRDGLVVFQKADLAKVAIRGDDAAAGAAE